MDSRVCTKKGLSQKEVFFVYSEPPKILKPTEGPFVLTMAIHGWLSVKQLPAMQETHEMQVQSLAREDPLQEEMPTHSSILTGPVRHSYGQRSLEAYIPQGCKELDTIELHYINYINTEIHTHTHTLLAWHEPNNQSEVFQVTLRSDQTRSVAQSCPTLCDPMNRSTPGLPVHHQLPEFTQTHVHWVSDAIQPSHPLSSPSPLAPNPFQHESFPMSQLFA